MDKIYGDIFEWDQTKAEINAEKHGVTFEEATTVFSDAYALVIDDPDHSEQEDRFVILGLALTAEVLVVCHCWRDGKRIRIISARKATKREDGQYWRCRHEG
ncbi:MAG: BrnT family toxin [Coriobacteriaceae bacterium]|jgi:uncharacterized protein|nr:MAG: BrnT family toxin [Coriobacteriaceae bacterium]